MWTLKGLTALTLLFTCLAGCGGADEDIAGPTWTLTELQGSAPIEGTVIDLTITDDMVSGSSGCNRYVGLATVEDVELTLGPDLAGTLMSCADDIMAQEQTFIETLNTVTSYEISGDELRLLDESGAVVARFT